MKFHRLVIENITSLKGKTEINFDRLLEGEQIFAITGNTGSGKSSILAAISLALYGDSHKKSLNNDDFVTLGSHYGKVILDFSIAGKYYQSTWECRVAKKNGEPLKTPKIQRSLSHNNKLLGKSIEEVIGLNFEQFCKTVILNQGEFARFISSNFRGRRDILEKLYGNQKLALISKQLSSNIKTNEIKVENLKTKLETALPYQPDEIESFSKLQSELRAKLEQKSVINEPTTGLKNSFKDLLDLIAQFNQATTKKSDTEKTLSIATSEYNQAHSLFKKSEKELEIAQKKYDSESPKLQEASSLEKEISLSQNFCRELEKQIENGSNNISKLNDASNELLLQIKQFLEKSQELKKANPTICGIKEDELDSLNKNISTISNLSNKRDLSHQNLEHFNKTLQSAQSKSEEIQKQISKINIEYDIQDDSERYQQRRELLHTMQNDLQSKLALLGQLLLGIKKEKDHQKDLEFEQKKIQLDTEKNDLRLEKIRNNLRNTKTEIEKLDLEHAKQKCLVESIKKHKCVVCSAPIDENLSVKNPPFKTVEQLRAEEIEIYQDQIDAEKALESLVVKGQNIVSALTKSEEELEKISAQIVLLFEDTAVDSNKPETIQSQVNKLNQEIASELKEIDHKIKSSIAGETQISSLKKQSRELEKEIEDVSKRAIQNKTVYDEYNQQINDLIKTVLSIRPDYPSELPKLVTTFERDYKSWNEFEKNNQKLNALEERRQMTVANIEDLHKQVEEAKINIARKRESIQGLENKKKDLCPHGHPPTILNNLTSELQSLKIKKEGQQSQTHHKERNKERLSATLDTINDRLNDIEHMVINHVTICKGFAKDVKDHITHDVGIERFQSALQKIEEIDYQTDVTKKEKQLQYFYDTILIPFEENLNQELGSLKDDLSQYQIKIEMYQSKIKDQEQALKDLKVVEKELYNLKDLQQLIGNNEFRNYILGLIEQQLLQFANSELNSLCDGRYELFQQEKRSAQEFFVIDHWRNGLPRKISTLSGGETFLVSLAMALSLADMTRGQTEIDSFYIDEGFGSLDSESIDDALDILSRVRSRGKQIGIISHVTSLTDRIPINIKVTKSQFGESVVRAPL